MNRYIGTFKNNKDEDIQVSITPSTGTWDSDIELKFTYDEPVKITQESDGLFTPVKTQGCTIKIFTDDIYWDLYAPASTTYYVRVYNTTTSFTLFKGYLTPCIYTQDYAYNGELELEAVDFLSVLDTFDYTENDTDREIISVGTLLNHIFSNIPNWNTAESWTTGTLEFDFTQFYIQESNFWDDDDEPMTCKEILEELFNYLGLTILMYNGKIWIVDYTLTPNTQITLNKDLYGAGTPSVELDEVYNKISVGCNLYEVKELTTDFFDKEQNKTLVNLQKVQSSGDYLYSDFYWSWREHNHHTKDKHRYTMYVKPYTFTTSDIIDNKSYKYTGWKTYNRLISTKALATPTIEEKAALDCGTYKNTNGHPLFIPQYFGAYPVRQYSFNKAEGMDNETDITWKEMILFPVKHQQSDTAVNMAYPAITFNNNNSLSYSLLQGTGYIVINCNIWYQSDIGISGVDDDHQNIWCEVQDSSGNTQIRAIPICLDEMDLSFDSDRQTWAKRESGDTAYNTGWAVIKCSLRVGNKYWNGSAWTTTASTFNLRFHTDSVSGDDETFKYYTWMKPAENPNVHKYEVGKEGYAIPILAGDYLNGKMEFTIYTPNVYDMRTVNNVWMKSLSVDYAYKDATNWAEDEDTDDDIVYENIINEAYATEMDELDLKINSWYQNKPISKSYFLDSYKRPVIRINGDVQEEKLIEKYYNHYSTAKKKFNLNYQTIDLNPVNKYYHTPTDTTYVVDGFDMDVKSCETELNLIEV